MLRMYSWGNGSKGQLGTGSMQAPGFVVYEASLVLDQQGGTQTVRLKAIDFE